uniref:Uncharacterized protein LOC111123390 n=1 Tax=Crassostrea virginica TaxID=6565 RepID=A0A8B8CZT2_CRAVI|nr:uncharacterized protein LOC111123390 [Crassostrea virginica]XP_022321400.1 uncharacterized protein LOC111123390 [Crassostrea virginica]XP_022321401.1 uncharacterized protein LOC111123390 [Crassostrea virginica]XP_022321402.1 uncharacterized protein LOC111123390 [Crassostrea virginica]
MELFSMDLRILAAIISCIGLVSGGLCQSGEVMIYKYPDSPFPQRRVVTFKTPFKDRPAVMYGIKMIDSPYNQNTRANVRLLWVRPERFALLLSSSHDTNLYGLGVVWMACP